jgi:protein SCO1/2
MDNTSLTRLIRVVAWGAIAGAVVAAGLLHLGYLKDSSAQLPGPTRIGGSFKLSSHEGRPFSSDSLEGKPYALFFGFTNCPDICPAELQVMAASLDELATKADKVAPIFITLDPERDTPEAVGAYVKNFGTRFIGLSGSPEDIGKASKAYRVAHSKFVPEAGDDKTNYSVDHTAFVYLMGADGQYITHFPYGTPSAKMVETLRRYL